MTARIVTDPDELRGLFARDPRRHLYALVDLHEPYWSASTWWRRGDAAVGLIGFPGGDHALYALSSVDEPGTLELVADLQQFVPPCQVIAATGCCDLLERAGRKLAFRSNYRRYHLADRALVPPSRTEVVHLQPSDVAELQALYDLSPGAVFFLPHMLDDLTFVGIRDHDTLVAVAGTHVIADDEGVAALGAIFTHPQHRGAGLGKAVTAAVVHRVADRVPTIGLNCEDNNAAAIAIYTGMGFEAVMAFEESEITE